VGESQAPASLTAADFADVDAVYFCKGDVASLRAARAARVLVVTARVLDVLREADVPVDALVCSAADPRERYTEGDLSWTPNLVARTEGAAGGRWSTPKGSGRWDAQPLPSEPRDAYGCGDSFAAGLTYALGAEMPMPEALAFAAGRGAGALCRSGAHGRF
jgi:ribokinase